MSLFEPDPVEQATPAEKQEYTIVIKQTRSGHDIMVCTAPVAPPEAIAEAELKNLPLFVGNEIMRMSTCPPEMVDHIIAVKLSFPGCSVEQIINGATPT